MEFKELAEAARAVRERINDLRTSAYTEHSIVYDDQKFSFYASFDLDSGRIVYNVVRDGFEIKLLSDLVPAMLVEYAAFVKAHEAWAEGKTSRPYYNAAQQFAESKVRRSGPLK